jgi:cellulose synthase/poly-beta-1,6-N-acetylglucosamine synthase-like glycosyltransferase
MIVLLSTFCLLAAVGLSLYGILGLITLWLYWRHRHVEFPLPELAPSKLPPVTVQLPIYNERYVVDRLINAAVSLDYPRDRLQIQVLDDSTDDTTQRAGMLVERYRDVGVDISLLHRSHRQGYKAGALSEALAQAQGEYLVIFDADFQPPADFLRQTMPHFKTEPRLGMVQARWGHLNSYDSPVTAAQAIALDKHFVMEQTVRHRANLFPRFNGAGGIWRRACLTDAGGWQVDTVCEDLCLSTRAPMSSPRPNCPLRFPHTRISKRDGLRALHNAC